MERPYLSNFSAIIADKKLSIRAYITELVQQFESTTTDQIATPIQSIGLFSKKYFIVKFKFLNSHSDVLFEKEFQTSNYGKLDISVPKFYNGQLIYSLKIYETSYYPGVEVYLGSFLPIIIQNPKKIVISDFDKTLVDTKYSTPKEMYYSLNKPLTFFPTLNPSVDLLKEYIEKKFQPFILSASPHFYEKSIRDWLYQNKIFASDIYLKDYRDFVSFFEGTMTTKDIKKQGYYKLSQLVDIILMTGIPEELVLLGDGFESDIFIYLILRELIVEHTDPWKLWKSIKNHSVFTLNSKQDSYFLTKFYRVSELSKQSQVKEMKIYIRATEDNKEELQKMKFEHPHLIDDIKHIQFYTA
ncbi:MAG: hypothetical protein CME62_04585 [Halobacteriovoraceae bacterium]|nr:hypothetical protein [Halobacteriovoraceae bacterium]|tara:strand:- start:5151 stop:6218 length:1068 start_codon:yes stop_codon:yes gene_type:complete